LRIKEVLKQIVLKRYLPYPYRRYNDLTHSIFIHIPKTAGTSMLQAIGAPVLGRLHVDYTHYMQSDPKRFASYYKFAVVRDPVDRVYSCYKYLTLGGNQSDEDKKLTELINSSCGDFDGFVQDFMTTSVLSNWNMLRPQTSFICSRVGELMVDYILRYESLDSDYQRLREHLPMLPIQLPQVNVSEGVRNVPASADTMEKLKDYYRSDIDAFYDAKYFTHS
jgi:hypothetical protein